MQTRETEPIAFPDDAELAALRAWYAGLDAAATVACYFCDRKAPGTSSRGVLGGIRRASVSHAALKPFAFLGTLTGRSRSIASRPLEHLDRRGLNRPIPLTRSRNVNLDRQRHQIRQLQALDKNSMQLGRSLYRPSHA
jgi:hypothetical protein